MQEATEDRIIRESIENKLIQLPSAETLTQRFINNKLQYLVDETQIIQQLADTKKYPFTISVIVVCELLKIDKNVCHPFERCVEKILELILQDLPKQTVLRFKFLGIIPYRVI